MPPQVGRSLRWMLTLGLALATAALVSVSAARAETDGAVDDAPEVTAAVGGEDSPQGSRVVAEPVAEPEVVEETDDYDPWQFFK